MDALRIDRLCRRRGSLIDGRGTTVLSCCHVAERPLARLVGLLATRELKSGEGLLLVPCRSIHTFGMRVAIDCAMLDRDGVVLQVVAHLGPGRTVRVPKAHAVVEAGAGDLSLVRAGDRLAVVAAGGSPVDSQIFPH